MATPFLDSLTPEQRAAVRRRALGDRRPSYYSSALAQLQEQAKRTGNEASADFEPQVQISEDLEALLILMSPPMKRGLTDFLQFAISASLSTDDLDLMSETVDVRRSGYVQVNVDVAGSLLQFDRARASILAFVEQERERAVREQDRASARTPDEDPDAVLIPDLSVLFAVLSADHNVLSSVDIMAVHDRVADQAVLYAYLDTKGDRLQELTSWLTIVNSYL